MEQSIFIERKKSVQFKAKVKEQFDKNVRKHFKREYFTQIPYPYITIPIAIVLQVLPGISPPTAALWLRHKRNVDAKLNQTNVPN